MRAKAKPEAATRAPESSAVLLLSEWVRQGTESLFSTQRILLDLVMRQNTNTVNAVQERLVNARTASLAALTEVAGEGVSNLVAAQRVILQLAQRQNEIVLSGIRERAGRTAPLTAVTDLLRREIDNFIDMQQHLLTIAAKQADVWIDAAKERRPFDGKRFAELVHDAMENFVRSQKKFLDVLAEETAYAVGAKNGKEPPPAKKAELTVLAREAAEAFIDAQMKLLDIAAQQMTVNVKVTKRAIGAINPFPPMKLSDVTRNTVDMFMAAQKTLLDVLSRPVRAIAPKPHEAKAEAPARKHPRRKRTVKTAAAAA